MSYQNRSLREIIFENNAALNTTIAAETSRAQTAEQANAAAILAEEQRVNAILLNAPPLLDTFKEVVDAYEAADQSLTLITNNNTNNITALGNNIAAEITRATGAESANTTSITNEVARATAAESANATDIATETTRATTAETANAAAINAEIARATAAEGANTTNLNTEITRAQTAEGLNTTNLNAEITRAIAAESLNTSNLNAEITRATNAEVANAQNISNQGGTITALQQQVNINTTTIGGLFTQQGTNTTAIAQNTTDIATNTTNIASNTTDIATNTTNIATNTTNIATNTTDIATNATNIAAEITRATAAEQANDGNIALLATNAFAAINTKQNIITSSTALTTGALTATEITNNIDLRNNLVAGPGVSLTQTGNNTTINNTATGTSQLYYFRATSNRANPVQAVTTNTVVDYNDIIYDVPSGNYDEGNQKYVVPIAGTFQFFFQAFQLSGTLSDFLRVGIFQNNTLMGMGGGYVANCERVGVILECAVGDEIQVKGVTGNEQVYMAPNYSWFEGYLLAGSSQLSTSTQYYFKAKGAGNQSISTGATNQLIDFNVLVFQNPTGYDTTNKEYVVQVAGLYQFFYQLFFLMNNANAEVRFGLYLTRGGTTSTISQNGQVIFTAERLGLTYECLVGDKISVRVVYNNSGGVFNVEKGQSWFEGYLLQPENNTVTSTTDLTINSLTINANLNSETFIRTVACAKILSSGANSKAINCSVNRTNTGRYTFTFNSPRPTADYVINITIAENSVILDDVIVQVVNGTQTASGFNYFIHEQDNGTGAGVYRDRPSFISIFDTD